MDKRREVQTEHSSSCSRRTESRTKKRSGQKIIICALRANEDKMERESEDKMKENPAGREQTESDRKNK